MYSQDVTEKCTEGWYSIQCTMYMQDKQRHVQRVGTVYIQGVTETCKECWYSVQLHTRCIDIETQIGIVRCIREMIQSFS